MLKFKGSVRVDLIALNNYILRILEVVLEVFDSATVTSISDGKHGNNSLHYSGLAVDFRIWNVKNLDKKIKLIKAKLGIDYDVVTEKNHLHVEYDPK